MERAFSSSINKMNKEFSNSDYNIAIIPARGGSKGILKKNISIVLGKPLVAWSIEQAKKSKNIHDVFVSTDDNEISEVAIKYGAKVIVRPLDIAKDDSPSEDALIHAVKTIEDVHKKNINLVVFLQATSPLRDNNDIDDAIELFLGKGAESLFSCSSFLDHFLWEKHNDEYVSITYDYKNRKRRQELNFKFLENGSIYIFKPEILLKQKNRLGGKIEVYQMPEWKSFQIDKKEDILICEYFLKKIIEENK